MFGAVLGGRGDVTRAKNSIRVFSVSLLAADAFTQGSARTRSHRAKSEVRTHACHTYRCNEPNTHTITHHSRGGGLTRSPNADEQPVAVSRLTLSPHSSLRLTFYAVKDLNGVETPTSTSHLHGTVVFILC